MKNIYAPALLSVFLILAGVILIPTFVIWHSGENWPKISLAKYQMTHDAVLAFGLVNDEETYKKAVYSTINPEVVIIGSSRVLQYRSEMFSHMFYNMGRGLELFSLKNEIGAITQNPNLKIVLFGLDYWNFGNRFCDEPVTYKAAEQAVGVNSSNISKFSSFIPREVLHIWPMFFDGRISFPLFLRYMTDRSDANKLGLRALYSNKGGYLKDGSYIYLAEFLDQMQMARTREKEVQELVDGGAPYQIPKTERFCNKPISDLQYIHDHLKEKGVEFIVFLPPLPEKHARLIIETEHGRDFYTQMMAAIKTLEPEIIVEDYLNPELFTFSDAEFIDQMHPGEVISYRILQDLTKKYPALSAYLNIELIDQNLLKCADKAVCVTGYEKYILPQ